MDSRAILRVDIGCYLGAFNEGRWSVLCPVGSTSNLDRDSCVDPGAERSPTLL